MRTNTFIRIFPIVALFILLFLFLLKPISDNDFFWHLKSGEWIWLHNGLPQEDHFSYTTPDSESVRKRFILTSYWLSQTIYYAWYRLGGMSAIVVLRFLITGALIYFLFKRKRGDVFLYSSLVIIAMSQFLSSYPLERPHVFSFMFFVMLLYLLEHLKYDMDSSRGMMRYLFIPMLMLVWANMHGGYLLGQVVIVLYIIGEGLKYLHPSLRPLKKEVYRDIVACGVAGIVLSLVNPNTWHATTVVFSSSAVQVNNLEYKSSLAVFRELNDHRILLYWFFLLLVFIGFVTHVKKIDITELVLLAGTGYFSFMSIRYIPFFMFSALPFLGRTLSGTAILKPGKILIFAVALYFGVSLTWDVRMNVKNIAGGNWMSNFKYPVNAANFIAESDMQGQMYNAFEWGGYLGWRLAPERKVFMDGRVLSDDVFKEAMLIDNAHAEDVSGIPFWKASLNSHDVHYVVLPLFTPSGTLRPLMIELLRDNEWMPVFLGMNSMVFVRDALENGHIIKYYAIPKGYFILGLIDTCNELIKRFPNYFQAYFARSEMYMFRKQYDKARRGYEMVLRLAPNHSIARERLRYLDQVRNGRV